jgi:proteasome assembly chaperone (PAC2) family protein
MQDWKQHKEIPQVDEVHMIIGWRQWADAGSISSGLPEYLISETQAELIGQIKSDDFYLFQFPGTHHYLRPEVRLEEGYPVELRMRKNELFFSQVGNKGLAIFLGDEPHLNVDRYSAAFCDMIEALNVRRVVGVAGVYGSMPYDKDRDISCAYSLLALKETLEPYAVRFSNYEGGATIGSYVLKEAERRGIEIVIFYAFVPAYDLSQISHSLQGMRIENDYKAWHDLMRRINHMFDLNIDLTDLEQHSDDLIDSMSQKLDEMQQKNPQLKIQEYIEAISERFIEQPFMPLDDVWARELGDLFGDTDETSV